MEKVLHIKNMVCDRCIKVVKDELEKLHYNIKTIKLGEVVIDSSSNEIDSAELRKMLTDNGFELIDDKNSKLIGRIKVLIINKLHHQNDLPDKFNFPKYLSSELGINYNHLSSVFSSVEGTTIEKFIIRQKIEKVKELLAYDELTLSEISYKLGYSSVQHLSNQFKHVTGLNPSYFKKLKEQKRKPIDKVI
ncbi:MAG TPA: AraC family transcriptional regulator [Ignavibacteriaceae bacterium]|nr:AraC family transcriptional regulator [Ignavibacteriaceae bacterium]